MELAKSEVKNFEDLRRMAAQIAHDIRSPLSVLTLIARKPGRMNIEEREILRMALDRIQGIAFSISNISKSGYLPHKPTKCFVRFALEKILEQKRFELNTDSAVEISLDCSQFDQDLECVANFVEFQRMISNLINNAVEACEGKDSSHVRVVLAKIQGGVQIDIQDNGKGIPAERLSLVGERGVTFGKPHGGGLGVFHAKKCLEDWGGTFRLLSVLGRGTNVSLSLRC